MNTYDKAVSQMEPIASDLHLIGKPTSDAAVVSTAISLKRIADALEQQNELALALTQGLPTGEDE